MFKSLLCGLLVGAAVEFVVLPILAKKYPEGSTNPDSWLGQILEEYRARVKQRGGKQT